MSSGGNGTFGCNYGGALQGYALVTQLRKMGFDAHDVHYVSKNITSKAENDRLSKLKHKIKQLTDLQAIRFKVYMILHKKELAANMEAFQEFVKKNDLAYNNGKFYSIEELSSLSEEFYAFITGSDVVWDPYNTQNKNDEGYFLDFCTSSCKRIAYAPSIGVTKLPPQSEENLKELLEKFSALSIREKSGSDLIKNVTGINVPVVLDPTLLVDPKEYERIVRIPDNLPEHYIAVYRFGNNPHTDIKIREISRKYSLPVVFIPARNEGFSPRYDLGPGEFIGVIRKADLVITDSFHCTIFSLLNHTPFLTFVRSNPKNVTSTQSRVINLLETFDMTDRYILPDTEIEIEDIFSLDFNKFEGKISKMREESLNYLDSALK